MAKFAFEVAVGFLPQVAEGTYNPTLDGITTSWATSGGLMLGDPESGIGESGLSLTVGRSKRDKAFLAGSFPRSLSDFLKAEVPSFEFAFPFCGSRVTAPGAPADADAILHPGLGAPVQAAGVAGPPRRPRDRRATPATKYPPAGLAIATATVAVGSVLAPTLAALPTTLNYTTQASVSAPVVQAVANAWQETRGFEELTLSIEPAFEEFPDSNAPAGVVKEASDREVKISGRLFSDDAATNYDLTQILATSSGTLDQVSFQVGASMTTGNPAVAHPIP